MAAILASSASSDAEQSVNFSLGMSRVRALIANGDNDQARLEIENLNRQVVPAVPAAGSA